MRGPPQTVNGLDVACPYPGAVAVSVQEGAALEITRLENVADPPLAGTDVVPDNEQLLVSVTVPLPLPPLNVTVTGGKIWFTKPLFGGFGVKFNWHGGARIFVVSEEEPTSSANWVPLKAGPA